MFAHFGRLLFEMLKFSTLSHAEMLERVEFEGEDRARLAYAQGKGVLFFTGHFGFWELHAIVHGLQLQPIGVLARALDNPELNTLLEDVRARTGNSVIYRQGAVRRVLKTLAAGQGVAMLIDQHMHSPDAIWVDFFRAAGRDDLDARGAGAANGRPVVPVFALPLPRRPLPHDLRARRRRADGRGPRCDSRVHAALHRRARDVRSAPSRAVAVDASPLARRAGARRQGHVPGGQGVTRTSKRDAAPAPHGVCVLVSRRTGSAMR